MASQTVMMDLTNSVVHRWNQTSATKKNTSGVKRQAFAFQLPGIAMAQTTVTIIQTNKIVDQFLAPTISSSARTQNVSSKLMFAMEKMIAVTIQTSHTNMHAWRLHSDVLSVNGNVLASQLVAST